VEIQYEKTDYYIDKRYCNEHVHRNQNGRQLRVHYAREPVDTLGSCVMFTYGNMYEGKT